MDQPSESPNTLWTYKDLARFLKVSEAKVRHDVMDRKIPFIKIGRSIRFDKNQMAEFLKIKIDEREKPAIDSIKYKQAPATINGIIAWLTEKLRQYSYAEIGVRLIIHDGKIKRIEKTVVEKILDEK
jgi:excisionase family DNA binding protein